jgi:riboflavin biosynthesis pyrimidine reductase
MTERFNAYCRRKEAKALAAHIPGYSTAEARPRSDAAAIGSDWTRVLFDGDFYRSATPSVAGVPVTSLVFVQSRDGNTIAPDPSMLGGGETDLHLVYEGLSRIDADAVLAGAGTARAKEIVFSIWHPELVALRRARGRSRHPAQAVITESGNLRFDDGLMFQEPELRVFVITRSGLVEQVRSRLRGRSWVEVIDAGEPLSPTEGLSGLSRHGIGVVSCVGGARTATALLREGLVTDIYLTTSAIEAGAPNSPYYAGPPLPLERVLLKEGRGEEAGVTFEHFIVK